MRSVNRIVRTGEDDSDQQDALFRDDPLAGHLMPLLPPAPMPGAPAVGAVLQEVIHIDSFRQLVSDGQSIRVSGTSSAKGNGGGGGGSGGGGDTGGTVGSYTSGAAGGYNITILFKGTWTATMQGVFKESADRISRIIVGDIPSVRVNGRTVDDIQITAELASIDGAGGILGQAGPTALRSASYLPATGMMQFDSADADAYQGAGLFDDIVTHEMLHCIGFGSIWSYKGLVSGSSFIGANAMAAYDDLVDAFRGFENNVEALLVPLETGGGSGTAGSHWSEAVFGSELMTGYINTSAANGTETNPLSALTVAAMKDLGYVVSSAPPVDGYYLT